MCTSLYVDLSPTRHTRACAVARRLLLPFDSVWRQPPASVLVCRWQPQTVRLGQKSVVRGPLNIRSEHWEHRTTQISSKFQTKKWSAYTLTHIAYLHSSITFCPFWLVLSLLLSWSLGMCDPARIHGLVFCGVVSSRQERCTSSRSSISIQYPPAGQKCRESRAHPVAHEGVSQQRQYIYSILSVHRTHSSAL